MLKLIQIPITTTSLNPTETRSLNCQLALKSANAWSLSVRYLNILEMEGFHPSYQHMTAKALFTCIIVSTPFSFLQLSISTHIWKVLSMSNFLAFKNLQQEIPVFCNLVE